MCTDIYLVVSGEVSVKIPSGFQFIELEVLYKHCSFGSYTCMMKSDQ